MNLIQSQPAAQVAFVENKHSITIATIHYLLKAMINITNVIGNHNKLVMPMYAPMAAIAGLGREVTY